MSCKLNRLNLMLLTIRYITINNTNKIPVYKMYVEPKKFSSKYSLNVLFFLFHLILKNPFFFGVLTQQGVGQTKSYCEKLT